MPHERNPARSLQPVLRDKLGRIVSGVNNPHGQRPAGSRRAIRELFKEDGGKRLYEIMLELAEGKAYEPIMGDGRKGPIMVPSPDVRLRAATELAHTLNGRPVSQAELSAAERDSQEVASIRALDDSTLRERAKAVLAAGLASLDAKAGRLDAVDADLVEDLHSDPDPGSDVD